MNKKIYAKINGEFVEQFFSTVFEQPKTGDILVEEGDEEYHAHVHLKYAEIDQMGCHNYKVVKGKIAKTTEEEKTAELAAREKPGMTPEQIKIEELQQQLTSTQLALTEIYESLGV